MVEIYGRLCLYRNCDRYCVKFFYLIEFNEKNQFQKVYQNCNSDLLEKKYVNYHFDNETLKSSAWNKNRMGESGKLIVDN